MGITERYSPSLAERKALDPSGAERPCALRVANMFHECPCSRQHTHSRLTAPMLAEYNRLHPKRSE